MNRLFKCSGAVLAGLFAMSLALMACEAPSTTDDEGSSEAAGEVSEDGPDGIDYGGIEEISDDADLIEEGEALFGSKGCVGCHQMDNDTATGPALGEVTDRRTPIWLAKMIMHPDEMQANDPVAQKIGEDFPAPMLQLNLTAEETEAILAYLKAY